MDSSDSDKASELGENSNSNLTLEEKREIVYQVSENPQNATEILQAWSRKELVELICIEMGKERKCTGLTKPKMINQLLRLVSRNATLENLRGNDAKYSNRLKRKSTDANGENLKGKVGNSPKRKSIDANGENSRGKDANSPNGHKRKSTEDVNGEKLRGKYANSPNGVKKKSIADVNGENSRGKEANSPNRLKRKTININTDNSGDQIAKHEGFLCQNAACKAKLNEGDIYCKRCSCCICCKFDENKDPSLWLECNSDPPFSDESCGATCHLNCALKHERAGIWKKGLGFVERLDGGFYCVFCGKVNSLLGCLRKQIITAINSRRVDSLCERLSLSRKILKGTENHKEIEKFVNLAVTKLKKEVGPLDRVSSANLARGGIVNRLNCGAEVQKLCGFALEALDQTIGLNNNISNHNSFKKSNKNNNDNSNGNEKNQPKHQECNDFQIQFEEINDTSITVTLITKDSMFDKKIIGCSVWHGNCKSVESASKTEYLINLPKTKILLTGLDPSTRYFFKARPFSSKCELGRFEAQCCTKSSEGNPNGSNGSNGSNESLKEGNPNGSNGSNGSLKAQCCTKGCEGNPNGSNGSNGSLKGQCCTKGYEGNANGSNGSNESLNGSNFTSKPSRMNGEERYEYCVRVIRWLEGENFLEREFRVRFLTWFSVKATEQERRIVGTFIDVLLDEPIDLVSQLVHSFGERIGGKERGNLWGDKKEVFKGFKGKGCLVV